MTAAGASRDQGVEAPSLRFLVPASNENRWSDLLAALIETDPSVMCGLLGHVGPLTVHREVVVAGEGRRSDRLDILLSDGEGRALAVIEAKVLSDLGAEQLERYEIAFPDAGGYWLLYLDGLPLHLPQESPWRSLTWERVLTAHVASGNPWVSSTASAWLAQMGSLVPDVDGSTVWRDVRSGAADFEMDLRARMVWLSRAMDRWCSLDHDLLQSTAGGSWVARMWALTRDPRYTVNVEVEEAMTAQAWRPDPDRPYADRIVGPSVRVLLRMVTDDSAEFDWPLLFRLFQTHLLDADGEPTDGRPWRRTRPGLPDPDDKVRWRRAVEDSDAPTWIGHGFGARLARKHGVCMFGARYVLAPTSTLAEIDADLRSLEGLIERMAARV